MEPLAVFMTFLNFRHGMQVYRELVKKSIVLLSREPGN